MGRLRALGVWSLAVAFLAWIPYSSCEPSNKGNAIKLVKPPIKLIGVPVPQEKLVTINRRQQTVSAEDDEQYRRPGFSYGPFTQGFSQGPPRYAYDSPDSPSERYDVEETPTDADSTNLGFMPEFGPPKGFPDLSKLTGGEFPKMDAQSTAGSYENSQYNYPSQSTDSQRFRPFPQFSPQGGPGGPQYYEESEDDGPQLNDGGLNIGGPLQGPTSSGSSPQQAPQKRKHHRGGNRHSSSNRPNGFGGGPGPFGAPEGGPNGPYGPGGPEGPVRGGPGPYDGPSRPFGGSSSRGPRPGSGGPGGAFGSQDGPFADSSDGPRNGPFGVGPDGPPRGGPFGGNSADGPPRQGGPFGVNSADGPSRPGNPFGGNGADGPPRQGGGPFGGNSADGPPRGGPFGSSSSDGPSRPVFFNADGPSRPFGSPQEGPYGGGPEGPPSRPGSFSSLDGPVSRPGPFGGPSRPGPYGAPSNGGPNGPGNFGAGPDGAHSFVNQGPPNSGAFRFSRGNAPRFHPNQIQNDDFKETADNGDFTPFDGPPQFAYPPRQQGGGGPGGFRSEEFEQSPYPNGGPPRGRRPEFSQPPQQIGNLLGSTHRHDSPKRPIVLKVSGLKTKYTSTRELPPGPPVFYAPSPDMKPKPSTSRNFQEEDKEISSEEEPQPSIKLVVKSRPKRDLEQVHNSTQAKPTSCKSKEGGCVTSSSSPSKKLTRKSASSASKRKGKVTSDSDPMVADGTQQAGYWDTAPYGVYNAYKKQDSNINDDERQDEYDVEDDVPTAPAALPARSNRKQNQTTYLDPTSDEQRFFPSFPAPAPYLNPFSSTGGFGRPPLFPGPTANRAPSRFHPQFGPKYTSPPPNRGPSSAYPAESHDRYLHTNLLGSGNFEVVRGGTYYGDDDDGYHHTTGGTGGHYQQEDDDGYFHHNGHSSPHGYRNNPSAGGGDFFANFRDFADINPPSRSFSHHHETVADAEPHGSASHSHEQPKNILDKLESSSDHIEVHQPYSRDSDPMMATF